MPLRYAALLLFENYFPPIGRGPWRTALSLIRALAANGLEMPELLLKTPSWHSQSSIEGVGPAQIGNILLASFAEYSIEAIPLKGPVLAETLYGDVTDAAMHGSPICWCVSATSPEPKEYRRLRVG